MIDVGTIPVFGLNKDDKSHYMLGNMNYLTKFHIKNCSEYKTLMEKFGEIKQTYKEVSDVPFIPVRLFKYTNLLSVPKKNIVKTTQGLSQILKIITYLIFFIRIIINLFNMFS